MVTQLVSQCSESGGDHQRMAKACDTLNKNEMWHPARCAVRMRKSKKCSDVGVVGMKVHLPKEKAICVGRLCHTSTEDVKENIETC